MALGIYLIDDERFMIKNMREQIDWAAFGLTVAGWAYDVETALGQIRELCPDIILTDIMMPGRNGIDLIRTLHGEMNAAKILVLSGHDRFSFAKEAMECGVVDYLLKPVRYEELCAAIGKTAELVRRERESQAAYTRAMGMLSQAMPRLRLAFTRNLINGAFTDESEPMATAALLGLPTGGMRYGAAVVRWQSELSPGDGLRLGRLLEEADFGDCAHLYAPGREDGTLLFITRDPAPLRDAAVRVLEQTGKALGNRLTAGMGNARDRLTEVFLCAREARLALLCRGEETVALPAQAGPDGALYGRLSGLLQALGRRDAGEAADSAARLLRACPGDGEARQLGRRLIYLTAGAVPPDSRAFERTLQAADELDATIDVQTAETLAGALRRLIASYLEEAGENDRHAHTAARMKEYLARHYREKISISELSARFYFTPNYLSSIFKEKTGMTILEYTTLLRMEEAKRLIRENGGMRMYEVAAAVGYTDPEHFRRLFKKIVGVNPTQFL